MYLPDLSGGDLEIVLDLLLTQNVLVILNFHSTDDNKIARMLYLEIIKFTFSVN